MCSMILGMAIGYYINFNWRINRFLRAAIIIPWILPPVISAAIWQWMMNSKFGVINDLLVRVGFIESGISWLGEPKLALGALVNILVWKNVPLVSLMLSAAYQTVPDELMQAGKIDGANGWQRYWKITFPSIRQTFLIMIIVVSIWCFQQFVIIWVTTQGGPIGSTHILPTYIYEMFFKNYRYGRASALSVFNILLLLGISFVYLRLFREKD